MKSREEMQKQIVSDMTETQRHEAEVKNLKDTIERLSKEVREYIKVEKILMAIGAVDEHDIEKAHDLVRDVGKS